MNRKKIKLGELCKPQKGQIKESPNTIIDYIDISSVDSNSKTITGYQTMPFSEAPSRARKPVEKNSVIVSTVRPNLNAVAVFKKETNNKPVVSTGFCVLDSKENVDYRFIFNFCRSKTFVDNMVSQATGASYPAVTDKIIRSALVPEYSYEEQCEISSVLDRISQIIESRKRELLTLDDLVKAQFVEMFGDPIHNTNNMPVLPMTDVCEIIDGDRGKNYPKQEDFFEEEYCLFLNAKNVTKRGFNFSECMYITKEKDDALRKGKLQRGDVVLTTRGTLGNLAFYTNDVPFENVRINSGMVILRMNRNIIDEGFFIEQFRMQVDDIKTSIASGSAQPQLPISTMNKIAMIVPDLSLQKEYTSFVAQVDKSKIAIQKSLETIQVLFDSLMQQYFG